MTGRALFVVTMMVGMLGLALQAQADIAPGPRPRPRPRVVQPRVQAPPPPRVQEYSLYVKNSNGPTKLILPARFRGAMNQQPSTEQWVGRSLRTTSAGIAISLAAVSVVLLRNKREVAKGVGIVALPLCCLVAGWASADLAVPPATPRQVQKQSKVLLEFDDRVNSITIIRGLDFPQ